MLLMQTMHDNKLLYSISKNDCKHNNYKKYIQYKKLFLRNTSNVIETLKHF